MDFQGSLQRRSVKGFAVGAAVEIWSESKGKWIRDGEVVERVSEVCVRDGCRLRAGSVKVLYSQRQRFRWIPPRRFAEQLRASARPSPPRAMAGQLQMEVGEGFWRTVHVELCKGFVQWWGSEAEAQQGAKSLGHAFLLEMELSSQGRSFELQASGSSHTFQSRTEEAALKWGRGLREHAAYCADLEDLDAVQQIHRIGGA